MKKTGKVLHCSYTVDTVQQRDNLTYAVSVAGDVIRVGDTTNFDDWKYRADGLWSKIYSTNCTFKIKDNLQMNTVLQMQKILKQFIQH